MRSELRLNIEFLNNTKRSFGVEGVAFAQGSEAVITSYSIHYTKLYDFIPLFYYFMLVWAIMGAVECIAINLLIPEMRSDIKGLYWVVKEKMATKKTTE